MTGTIRYLKIANYRSIDILELHDIKPFSVFAGPNGVGKSNFFEALDFVNWIIRFGADEALKKHGGFENIRCLKRPELDEFEFEIEIELPQVDKINKFYLKMSQLDKEPILDQGIYYEESKVHRQKISTEVLIFEEKINRFLENIRLYRIEPIEAKLPVNNLDTSSLHSSGRNLAAILNRLEKNEEIRETILEWIDLMVPGLESVQSHTERLSGNTLLAFKEKGIEKLFPAHMISDGTIYLLSLLVAMLDRPNPLGMTLIEEPERGLHPHAIIELVDSFREIATLESPIWVTTHNEALIRVLKNHELWLVDKKQGATHMKAIRQYDASTLPLDQAWLCNVLNGGLP